MLCAVVWGLNAVTKIAYSLSEAVELSPFGESKIGQFIREGALPARKIGERVFIMHDDLVRFLESAPLAANNLRPYRGGARQNHCSARGRPGRALRLRASGCMTMATLLSGRPAPAWTREMLAHLHTLVTRALADDPSAIIEFERLRRKTRDAGRRRSHGLARSAARAACGAGRIKKRPAGVATSEA